MRDRVILSSKNAFVSRYFLVFFVLFFSFFAILSFRSATFNNIIKNTCIFGSQQPCLLHYAKNFQMRTNKNFASARFLRSVEFSKSIIFKSKLNTARKLTVFGNIESFLTFLSVYEMVACCP